jgi:hypothetical protein
MQSPKQELLFTQTVGVTIKQRDLRWTVDMAIVAEVDRIGQASIHPCDGFFSSTFPLASIFILLFGNLEHLLFHVPGQRS